MKSFFRLVLIFITSFTLFYRCANVGQPTGGPKDLDPPKLLSVYPKDQSLNFSDKKIIWTFDEYIKLEDAKKQVIITPPIEEGKYEFKVKNNVLTLSLDEKLEPNTTYTLDLGESVRDITESNKAINLKLGFSTGDYIDSLSISGKVTNLMKATPEANIVVGIYNALDTFDIFNKRPVYFTKTDTTGFYQIDNIKNGNYRVYAMKDKNGNLKVEPITEAFGFRRDTLQLDSTIENINIRIQNMDIRPPKIQSSRPDGNYYLVKFNKGIKEYSINTAETDEKLFYNLIEENKTIRFYKTFQKDSVQIELNVRDSLNQSITEVMFLKFTASRKSPDALSVTLTPPDNEKIKEDFNAKVFFNKPITNVVADSLYFRYDSLNMVPIDPNTDFTWNETRTILDIDKKLNQSLVSAGNGKSTEKEAKTDIPKGAVRLQVSAGAFISIEADSNKQIQRHYKFLDSEEVGTIEGSIETEHTSYIIQLLDKNYKLIKEIKNQSRYKFNDVKPGDYRIRILVDNNNDGEWFRGNINQRIEPEEVVLFKEVITIRANWERKDVNISF